MREIPQCWMTGQAAGIGAAMIAQEGIAAPEVDVDALRVELRRQGAYLHDAGEAGEALPAAASRGGHRGAPA
jgi:hypothetical protein